VSSEPCRTIRVADGSDRRRDRLARGAVALAGRLGPGARLARLERGAVSVWVRYATAVGEALGPLVEARYTRLVLQAAQGRSGLGRTVAATVPDHVARVPPEQRLTYLDLLGLVLQQRPEALPVVVRTLPELMTQLSPRALRDFLRTGLGLHEQGRRLGETFLLRESEQGQSELERLASGLKLESVARTLALYARAHCGEDVRVLPAGPGTGNAFTDGRHIYLPESVQTYGDERDFLIYRVTTARTAGYLEFGTFDLDLRQVAGPWAERVPGESDLEQLFRSFGNRTLARDLFRILEDARVEAQVVDEYPGIGRDLGVLRPDELEDRPDITALAPVEQLIEGLLRRSWGAEAAPGLPGPVVQAIAQAWARSQDAIGPQGTVDAVAGVLPAIYGLADALFRKVDDDAGQRTDGFEPPPYEGLHDFDSGTEARPEALDQEARAQDEAARELREAMEEEGLEASLAEIRRALRGEAADGSSYEEMAAFLERMEAPDGGLIDEGEHPDDGEGSSVRAPGGQAQDPDLDPDAATVLLPEWDYEIQDYKPDWVRLKEHVLHPGSRDFVDEVMEEHGATIHWLRRRFEALRPQALQRIRGMVDGDFLDLDRVVDARVTRRAGGSPSDRLYGRHLRNRRDVAVAFLLDMSSSTNEVSSEAGRRIIEVEKQALVLISEAIDALGDACAIYGFSGYGRGHVAFYVAKDFDDPWDDRIRAPIGRMSWKMENRDGAAIRHAARRLQDHPARVHLLILLSDGKPLDCGCDHYYDRYAQEDTRVALQEARAMGVHPFCITVDPRGQDYLEDMYGQVGFLVIDRIERLPDRLPLIYRRLTR